MSQEKFEKIYFNVTELKSENITNYSITSLNNNLCNDEKINQDNQYRKQQFSHIFKTFSNKSELINSKKTKFCENNCLALNETSKNCILVKKKICNQYFFPGIMSQISIKPCLKRHVVFSFLKEIEDVYIKKNETANFKAIVHISEPFEIKWFIEKLQINTSLRKLSKIEKINDEIENLNFYEISLIIENSSYDDIGKYSLSIENEACHAICSAFLIIEEIGELNSTESIGSLTEIQNVKKVQTESFLTNDEIKIKMENLKPIIINYISDKFVKKNQNAYFEVEYYTEADFFEIIWYFKGKKLDDIERNRKYVIENESRITRIQIFDVNEDDCGEYECRIKNMYGESITKGNLLIKSSKKIKRKKYKTKF